MTVVITGGGGFVGSHLVDLYLDGTDRDVVVLDDFSTGRPGNLVHRRDHPRLRVERGDVRDEEAVESVVSGASRVYHLAAQVGVRRVVEAPVEAMETNLRGTENVLRAAAGAGAETFVASSSEVYGKSESVPFDENDDRLIGPPTVPRWGYATAKAADEFLALARHEQSGLPVVVGRLFNVVGPRQVGEYGMVVPRFVQQALAGDPITVYGDGTQTRSFTHVSDAVEILHRLMETDAATGEVVNVGTGEPVTIERLAERVLEVTGSSSQIEYVPFEEVYGDDFEEPDMRVPDTDKLRSLLSRVPETGLDRIVTDVVAEFRTDDR